MSGPANGVPESCPPVLLVDDNPLWRSAAVDGIRSTGIRVIGFDSIEAAWAWLDTAESPPDLLYINADMLGDDAHHFVARMEKRWSDFTDKVRLYMRPDPIAPSEMPWSFDGLS